MADDNQIRRSLGTFRTSRVKSALGGIGWRDSEKKTRKAA